VGHPTCYATGGAKQKLMGYYIALFQIRGLAEWLVKAGNWWALKAITRCHAEFDQWRKALAPRGRLTAGINYYRANLGLILPLNHGDVHVPVVGIYSTRDIALVEGQMTRSQQFCKAGWKYIRVPNVGHWMTVEAPGYVNRLLIEHLR